MAVLILAVLVLTFCLVRANKKVIAKLATYEPITATDLNDDELELGRLINEHRDFVSLKPLIIEQLATDVCRNAILSGVTSHLGWEDRLIECECKQGAEIMISVNEPKSAISSYLRSMKHRDAIENPNYTHIGIGFLEGQNICILVNY